MKYEISVRSLCEFTAKQGNLDLRFTPGPSAQEGIAGHGVVTSRRAPHYQREVSLTGEYKQLLVRGRADGFDPVENQLEEIKTFKGDLSTMPCNQRQLHWAQVRVYGWLLCQKLGFSRIRLALVYFDIISKQENLLIEIHDAETLKHYFEDQCERFLCWAEQELAHRTTRNRALNELHFPHSSFRQGQRELAEAVYRAARDELCLIAQAPTGIGKTIGTLFPLLKAVPGQKLDKIFFLTAKTSGRGLALDALELIRNSEPTLPLRVLELTARDKACEHPEKACHGESCPLARGFYDRLPKARAAALEITRTTVGNAGYASALDKDALRAIAREHQVCPYYLSQELVRWCDVIIGDYNHYFDLNATLYGLAIANQWRVSVLVDEAHNLLGRARKMYTAELDQAGFRTMRRSAPAVLKKGLDRVNLRWNELNKEQVDVYQVYPAAPGKFLAALQQAIFAITDYFTANPNGVHGELQRFYFDALHFSRMSELLDQHSLFDVTKIAGDDEKLSGSGNYGARSVLCLRNVIPAPFLAQRFEAAKSTTLFSATLTPWHFYRDTLGLPQNTAQVEVQSPFRSEQLSVQVISHVSTRYRHREASVSPIVDLISRQFAQRPGNYLAFFSSFDYLQSVTRLFRSKYPEIPLWEQTRGMGEPEQNEFLARFTPTGRGVGFAVLGGSFAEGIDLPGKRLSGAFIATLGLPQVNPVNEQIRQRMDAIFNAGYEYAYFFPGIQKIVQAAGRVIRTQLDEGIIYLIDDRFTRGDVLRLLPPWWKLERHKIREAR